MTTELKPCPFCGGHAVTEYDGGNEVWNQSWRTGCRRCDIWFKKIGSNSWASNDKQDLRAKRESKEDWNRRTSAKDPAP